MARARDGGDGGESGEGGESDESGGRLGIDMLPWSLEHISESAVAAVRGRSGEGTLAILPSLRMPSSTARMVLLVGLPPSRLGGISRQQPWAR